MFLVESLPNWDKRHCYNFMSNSAAFMDDCTLITALLVPNNFYYYILLYFFKLLSLCQMCQKPLANKNLKTAKITFLIQSYTCQLTAKQAYEKTFRTTCKTSCAVTSRLLTRGHYLAKIVLCYFSGT